MKRNQSGQMTLEMVMFAAIIMMMINFVSKKFDEYSILQEMTLNPWNGFITGMIENGVWGRADQTRSLHPHSFLRHSSVKGKAVQ